MTELERSLGAVITEVPITFDERIAGESKLELVDSSSRSSSW